MKPHFSNLVCSCDSISRYPKKDRPTLLVWYKYRWRKVIKFEPIEGSGETYNGGPRKMLIWFEGLVSPRKLHSGIQFYYTYLNSSIERMLELKQYWFQKHGPQFADLPDYYTQYKYKLNPKDFIEKEV
jgi:hypothetical protein